MNLIKIIFGLLVIGQSFTSCNKDCEEFPSYCDLTTFISNELYKTAPNDHLTILAAELQGDCLKIKFASGGCSGNSWEVKLIDSGAILYSYPPQRNLRLSLKNEELCKAYITKEITFDIKNLQVRGNKVLLNITNSGTQILYEY